MRVPGTHNSGKADPLGLLVLAVMLALTITIGIQAQTKPPYDTIMVVPAERLSEIPRG